MIHIGNLDWSSCVYMVCFMLVVYISTRLFVKTFIWNLPPGPNGLPILGYLRPISHLSLLNHRDLYGDVSYFHALGTEIVVLNSVDAIRDAFQSPGTAEVFSGRPKTFFSYVIYDDIIFRSMADPFWKEQRRVLHGALRSYGDGIKEIESVVNDELQHVKSLLKDNIENEVDINNYLAPSVLNIIYTLVNGERYDYNDEKIQSVIEGNRVANGLANPMVDLTLRVFPFLKYLPFGVGRSCQFIYKSSKVYLDAAYEQYQRLSEIERKQHPGVTFELLKKETELEWFTENMARGCVQNISGAGLVTTQNSLLTFFLVLLHHPDIQQRIQNEIDSCIGRNRVPNVDDRQHMPYTIACILELLRFGSNVALGVPHACLKSTKFRNYRISQGAVIIANHFRVHHDAELWKDPWSFDPTRFLDKEGKMLPSTHPHRQNLIAFGVGKRMCMGETFARTRIFLYISNLLQAYTFVPAGALPSLDPRTFVNDIVIHPPSYKMKVKIRTK